MCGILGCLFPVREGEFRKALATLGHRGPDYLGTYADGMVTLGHVRLSIIDLTSNAIQPMTDGSGRYTICYNGEIYNYLEIKKDLVGKGVSFRSESDTEVFLEAFKMYGVRCLDLFNGMWAAAIWDCVEKKLFLSRDRFGEKPLFYVHLKRGFVFASEMKAIYPFLDKIEPSELIPHAFDDPFCYESTERTVIDGIYRLKPGHFMHVELDGTVHCHRYYNLGERVVPIGLKYNDAVEQFRELFFSSVNIRMQADVHTGTALSGGLDSSSTFSAAVLQSKDGNRHQAFCAHLRGTPIDEVRYARQVAANYGCDLKVVEIDPLEGWEHIEYYLYLVEDPYITPPIPMIQLYRAMRQSGVLVSVDGHGADELLLGYGFSIFYALPDASAREMYALAKTFTELMPFSDDGQFMQMSPIQVLFRYAVKSLLKKIGSRRESPNKLNQIVPEWYDSLNRHLYELFAVTVLPTLLRNYDRYSMLNGVEVRMPFLDYRLVEFAFGLDWRCKISDGFTKKILRDAMSPFIPHEICWRKDKIGFNSPMVDWIRGPLREYVHDFVNSRDFVENEWVDKRMARHLLNKINHGEAQWADGEKLWSQIQRVLWKKSLSYAVRLNK